MWDLTQQQVDCKFHCRAFATAKPVRPAIALFGFFRWHYYILHSGQYKLLNVYLPVHLPQLFLQFAARPDVELIVSRFLLILCGNREFLLVRRWVLKSPGCDRLCSALSRRFCKFALLNLV